MDMVLYLTFLQSLVLLSSEVWSASNLRISNLLLDLTCVLHLYIMYSGSSLRKWSVLLFHWMFIFIYIFSLKLLLDSYHTVLMLILSRCRTNTVPLYVCRLVQPSITEKKIKKEFLSCGVTLNHIYQFHRHLKAWFSPTSGLHLLLTREKLFTSFIMISHRYKNQQILMHLENI